jgi:hypothetical protein
LAQRRHSEAARGAGSSWQPRRRSRRRAIARSGGELPLIGPAASSSWSTGIYQNHPGPVLYDALAVPAALFPGPTGLIIGTVLLEAFAVVGVFVLARRRGELRPFSRVGWVTGAVLVVDWIQPLIEQVSGEGEGNLSRVARGAWRGVWARAG